MVPKKPKFSEAIRVSPTLKNLDNIWFLCHLYSDLRVTLSSLKTRTMGKMGFLAPFDVMMLEAKRPVSSP